jgi:hypothetical protein
MERKLCLLCDSRVTNCVLHRNYGEPVSVNRPAFWARLHHDSPAPLQVFRHDPALNKAIQASMRLHHLCSGNVHFP